jgi:hypothetical protein
MSEATPKNGAPAGRRIDPVTASVIHGALAHIAYQAERLLGAIGGLHG